MKVLEFIIYYAKPLRFDICILQIDLIILKLVSEYRILNDAQKKYIEEK